VEGVKSIIRHKGTSKEDKEFLERQLKINTAVRTIGKVLPLAGIFLMYKKGHFEQSSKYMLKEVSTLVGAIGTSLLFNHFGSEFMWSNSKDKVRFYALEKEQDFYNLSKTSKDKN
jgi:hypothetical protein